MSQEKSSQSTVVHESKRFQFNTTLPIEKCKQKFFFIIIKKDIRLLNNALFLLKGIYDLQIDYNQTTNANEGFANKAFEASTNSFNLDLSQFIDLYDNNFIGIASARTMPKLAQKLIPDDVDRELRDVIEKRNVKVRI